jgi:hypothetical protein
MMPPTVRAQQPTCAAAQMTFDDRQATAIAQVRFRIRAGHTSARTAKNGSCGTDTA